MRTSFITGLVCAATFGAAQLAAASPIVYSNLAVNALMAAGSRPSSPARVEIEAADDFLLTAPTMIDEVKFIGLITGGGSVTDLDLEFYRTFPKDSDVTRTSGPPTFSTTQVPTRVNSPSDVEFAGASDPFTVTTLSPLFTAVNSVLNGINPKPGQTTGGEGAVRGVEVLFDVHLATPILLPADHYFFVPQVLTSAGEFYWLSASRAPIAAPGTPFSPDLQAWIRNGDLDPDWLRIGTDIVGGAAPPTFNMAFELDGTPATTPVPEPATLLLLGGGLASAIVRRRRAQ